MKKEKEETVTKTETTEKREVIFRLLFKSIRKKKKNHIESRNMMRRKVKVIFFALPSSFLKMNNIQ